MKYNEIKGIKNIDLLLLQYLNILTVSSEIYRISHFPDFNKTPYGGDNLTQYYFDDYWDFSSKYHSIIHVDVEAVYLLHFDDVCRISKKYNITYEKYDSIPILEKALTQNSELFFEDAMNPEFDGFSFHDLEMRFIDNHKKRILFHGGISASSDTVTGCDWDLYTELKLIAVDNNIELSPVYKPLLAEGCSLYWNKSFKLAFFIIYSALESYLNLKTNGEDEQIRIKEKLNIAFNKVFSNLSSHNIYNSILFDLKQFTEIRNTIAHGRQQKNVTKEECSDIMIFTCIVISSLEKDIESFAKLNESMHL